MSINPEYDRTVPLRPYPNGAEAVQAVEAPVDQVMAVPQPAVPFAEAMQPAYAPAPPPFVAPTEVYAHAQVQPAPARFEASAPLTAPARKSRSSWAVPVAVGVVGILATGSLGYFLWSTTGQRDAARHQLASTQVTLTGTQALLANAQQDAAGRKVTADYVSLYVVDSARVVIDDKNLNACRAFGQCRTAAQQELNDMQAFQSDRTKATVPAALANSDAMLGDALSSGIAGLQELISGMDNNNLAKITGGWAKLNKAMLSMGKAEAALGAGLK
ncbi:MAG TPA: hypothetical protein VHW94_09270 [Candidatus Dormibacteraeota bacterium]|jgi:hypothetical protein|nr:hypothetical protein [Candidatus Dormibacteraeota bacterium]